MIRLSSFLDDKQVILFLFFFLTYKEKWSGQWIFYICFISPFLVFWFQSLIHYEKKKKNYCPNLSIYEMNGQQKKVNWNFKIFKEIFEKSNENFFQQKKIGMNDDDTKNNDADYCYHQSFHFILFLMGGCLFFLFFSFSRFTITGFVIFVLFRKYS